MTGNPQDGATSQRSAGFAGQAPNKLPDGWESAIAPGSGKVYYANRITGEASWELPQAAAIKAAPAPPPAAAAGFQGSDQLPEGWEQAVDKSTGKVYYANRKTGQSSWERPAAPPPPALAQQQQAPPPPPPPPPASVQSSEQRPPSPPRTQAPKMSPPPPPEPTLEHLAAANVPTPTRSQAPYSQEQPPAAGPPGPTRAADAAPNKQAQGQEPPPPKRSSFPGLSSNFFGSMRQRMSFGRAA